MLGVIIGVAAVIAMVALGTRRPRLGGALAEVGGHQHHPGERRQLHAERREHEHRHGLGSATTLTREDADAIREMTGVQAVAGGVRNRACVKSAHRQFFTQVRGVEPALGDIHGWTWLGGEFTAARRCGGAGPGGEPASCSAKGFDPVGEKVTIGDRTFTVAGYFRTTDADQDEAVFIPLAAGQALLGDPPPAHHHAVGGAGGRRHRAWPWRSPMRCGERHGRGRQACGPAGLGGNQLPGAGMARADDFTVKTQAAANVTKGLYTSVAAFALANMPKLDEVTLQEMSGTLSRAGSTMTALLGSIAAISLIVGGIGIMNIMLVSVTERTKEIGLRLAVGARRRDVLLQFLVEAMVMSLIGGVLGVGIGLATAEGLTAVLEWPTEVSFTTVASAFAIAALVGVVFGYYPARRASRLDPIDSLRYE